MLGLKATGKTYTKNKRKIMSLVLTAAMLLSQAAFSISYADEVPEEVPAEVPAAASEDMPAEVLEDAPEAVLEDAPEAVAAEVPFRYGWTTVTGGREGLDLYEFTGAKDTVSITVPEMIDGKAVVFIGLKGVGPFQKMTSLEEISLPEGIDTIGAYAFQGDVSLKTINLTEGLTSIGSDAFRDCEALEAVQLPSTVKTIAGGAFYSSGLNSDDFLIPAAVRSIGRGAFSDCRGLKAIRVEAGNGTYVSEDGVLFSQDRTELICYPAGKTDASYTVPDSVNTIGKYAFKGNTHLKELILPDGLDVIEPYAFEDCSGLETLKVPAVSNLGQEPNNVGKLTSYGCFAGCSGLKNLEFAEGFNQFDYDTLRGCDSLEEFTLPASAEEIGSQTFEVCPNLKAIHVAEGSTHYKSVDGVLFRLDGTELIAYPRAKEGARYTIPAGTKSIAGRAFCRSSHLSTVILPESVKELKLFAFLYADSLQEVWIYGEEVNFGIQSFGEIAKSPVFHVKNEAVRKALINSYASYYEPNVIVGEFSVTEPGSTFTQDGIEYEIETLPVGEAGLGTVAVSGCADLGGTEFSIPVQVKFGGQAFAVNLVKAGAFSQASSLRKLNFLGENISAEDGAFAGIPSTAILSVKNSTVKAAFSGKGVAEERILVTDEPVLNKDRFIYGEPLIVTPFRGDTESVRFELTDGETMTEDLGSVEVIAGKASLPIDRRLGVGNKTLRITEQPGGASILKEISIVPKELTCPNAGVYMKVYDGTTEASIYVGGRPHGVVNGDRVSLNSGVGSSNAYFDSTPDVGKNKPVLAKAECWRLTGEEASFYTLKLPEGLTGEIHPASITVKNVDCIKVNQAGKRLKDCTLSGSVLPAAASAGAFSWVEGPEHIVEQGVAYHWVFTPDSSNYSSASGIATPWEPKIPTPSGGGSSGGSSSGGGGGSASSGSKVESEGKQELSGSEGKDQQVAVKAETGVDGTVSVQLDRTQLEQAREGSLKITADNTQIIFDQQAMKAIGQDGTEKLQISVKPLKGDELPQAVRETVGDRPVYDFKMTGSSSAHIFEFGGGKAKITLPYTLMPGEAPSDIVVFHTDENGTLETMTDCVYRDGAVTFSTSHFSLYSVGCVSKSFKDAAGHWAEESIRFAAARSLVSGVEQDRFEPDTSMTRGMLVSVLARLEKVDVAASVAHVEAYPDVDPASYYAGPIAWAEEHKIAVGNEAGGFEPDRAVTREELAVILTRFEKEFGAGKELGTAERDGIDEFTDTEEISAFAREAVKEINAAGLMTGKAGGSFDPQGTASRAEVSSVLERYIKSLNGNS